MSRRTVIAIIFGSLLIALSGYSDVACLMLCLLLAGTLAAMDLIDKGVI